MVHSLTLLSPQSKSTTYIIPPSSFNTLTFLSLTMSLTSTFKYTFLSILIFHCINTCTSSPPPDPIQCTTPYNTNCTITNGYGAFPDRSTCHVPQVAYPSTEQELISIVGTATKAKRKMRVATSTSHSIPKLVCLDNSRDGLIISTKNLNRVLAVNKAALTMTVESGVVLKDLIAEAAKVGLALPYTPYWWGATVGGVLGTGSHGSSFWDKGSAVQDYVVRVRIVSPAGPDEGYAVVRDLVGEGDNRGEFNAAIVSLGVLGVISQVTFQLQPMFKRSITYITRDDKDLADQVVNHGRQHEFADIFWFPSQRKVDYKFDDRVASNISGNGHNALPALNALPAPTVVMLRSTGIKFTGYPVIGYQNELQASGNCLTSPEDGLATVCPWDPRVKGQFYFQLGISISISKAKHFIRDVQKIVDLVPKGLCGIDMYNGILLRYITRSNAYLGKQEDSIDFDISYYRSTNPNTPRLYEDLLEEIEQMAVFKYGGLPHWGKNRNVAFDGVIKKYKNGGEFLKVKEKYDPLGLFSNEWTDQVLGLNGEVSILKEGCALEGLCVCSLDIHCAPSKGYFCRPGKVFKDARVCTLLS